MDTHHLRTILWLRWRLARNQWRRSGPLNAIVSLAVAVLVLIAGASGIIIGILIGVLGLSKMSPRDLLALWDVLVMVFLFLWMMGIVTEIQRSETIDIGRLLHLPISVKEIFLVNYLASHLSFTFILFVPGMLGLCVGLSLGRAPAMLILLLLVIGFVFMISAWTYCLRGWLVTLMANPRRRRAIIAGITFTFILLAQLPNLLGQMFGDYHHRSRKIRVVASEVNEPTGVPDTNRPGRSQSNAVWTVHQAVPFLWIGHGALSLAQGSVVPALWRTAVLFALGGLGLRRAYQTTLRFYLGQTGARKCRSRLRQQRPTLSANRRILLEKRLPCVSDEAGVLALATYRSMARAPEVKMMLATQTLLLLVFTITGLMRHAASISDQVLPFITAGAVILAFFAPTQLMFNQFGFDRNGFRSIVLWPAPRDRILLGRNLAFLPLPFVIGLILLTVMIVILSLPLTLALSGFIQLVTAFCLVSILGNLTSILVPYRIASGSLKPTKTRTLTTILIILSHFMFLVVMLPIIGVPLLSLLIVKAGWMSPELSNFLFSLILCSICLLCYKLTLAPLGRLLQQHEKRILDIVTQEVE